MGAEYKPLTILKEEYPRLSFETSTTLDGLDDQEKAIDSPQASAQRPASLFQRVSSSTWKWLVQAALLITSLTFFTIATNLQPVTLGYVREFSAWSPADTSVEYNAVWYNFTTKDKPFVGAGPEVDKAWRAISFDG